MKYSLILMSILFFSCDNRFLPKPKGYNKIILPEHDYFLINDSFPFSFEVSKIAAVKKSTIFKNEPYWIDLLYSDHPPIYFDFILNGVEQ